MKMWQEKGAGRSKERLRPLFFSEVGVFKGLIKKRRGRCWEIN